MLLLPPPLLTSLDEVKTATKPTPALTADVFQLSTPVASQNRAGVKPKTIELRKLRKITAKSIAETKAFLTQIEQKLGIVSTAQTAKPQPAAKALRALRNLCSGLETIEEKNIPLRKFSVEGKLQPLSEITDKTLHLLDVKQSIPAALEIVAQLQQDPFLLHAIAVIRAAKKQRTAKTLQEMNHYLSQLEALSQTPRGRDFKGSKVPEPIDAYRQLFKPAILNDFAGTRFTA
jgi:hypothetical protein